MADYYWIYNGTTAGNFQTAANWSQSASGSPASGTIPQADDFVHFGDTTTIGNNLGRGSCQLTNNTNALARMTLHEDYTSLIDSSAQINFTLGGVNSAAGGFDFLTAGFKIGMHINITGASNAGNNGLKQISSVTTNTLGFTSAVGMVVEAASTNVISFAYTPEFDLNGNSLFLTSPAAGTLLTLHGTIKATTTGYIFLSGNHVSGSGNRFILLGDNADFDYPTVFIRITGGTGGTRFDDGEYPRTELHGGVFSCDYVSPTSSKYNKAIFSQFFEAVSGITWVTSGNRRENVKKTFEILDTSNFILRTLNFKTGESRWIFNYSDNHFKVPVDGDYVNYPANFTVEWYNIEISNPSGNVTGKASIPARRSLNVNSLTINSNAKLIGDFASGGTTTVCSTTRPTIHGAWNFSQVADGVYTSTLNNSNPITPAHGVRGAVQLSYDGGSFISQENFFFDYDSSSLVLCSGQYLQTSFIDFCQTYDPSTGSGTNGTIWESNDSPTVLYYTDSDGTKHNLLAGGGGGADEKVKISAADPTTDYLGNKIVSGTNTGTAVNVDPVTGNQTLSINATDAKVGATATDGTPSNLTDKLLAGTNITFATTIHPTLGDQITINSAGGGGGSGVDVENSGVALGTATTLNFNTNLTATLLGSTATINAAGGGGGGGYPLFRHDQDPTTNNFSPFRLLTTGDQIQLGCGAGVGDEKDVSVFTPLNDEEYAQINISHIGAVGTNTGREYIFYGQGDRQGTTTYFTQLSMFGLYPTYFVESMRDVPVGGGLFSGMTALNVNPAFGVNNVRVIDAGEHQVLNASQIGGSEEPEEPSTVRILLIVDFQIVDDGRGRFIPNYRLRPSP